jgi:hypothetical protein
MSRSRVSSRKSMSRTLRTFECIAYTRHRCLICGKDILPGQFYLGSIGVDEHGVFYADSRHINPPCNIDE